MELNGGDRNQQTRKQYDEAALHRWNTQSPWLLGNTKREIRTTQESLIANMLTTIGFQFREQVPMTIGRERLIFDFLIEQSILVECTCSKSPCNRAWETMRQKLAYLDYKFRVARYMGTFQTIILVETPRCQKKSIPFPDMPRYLTATDYVVTTISQFGRLVIDLMAGETVAAKSPTTQRGLEKWLRGEISKQQRHRKSRRDLQHPDIGR